jgi:monooxygenase
MAKSGVKTTIVEKQRTMQASKWTILLYPVAMKLFDELGVIDEISRLGMALKGPEVDTSDGEVLAKFDAGLMSEPRLNYWLLAGPSEIRKILREHVISEGVELLEGVKFRTAIREPSGRISGAVSERDGDETRITSRVLVGADGHNSRVRDEFGCKKEEKGYPVEVGFFLDCEHGLDRMKMVLGHGSQMVILPNSVNRLNIGYTERGLGNDCLSREGGMAYLKRRMSESAPFLKDAIEGGIQREDSTALIVEPKAIHVEPWVVDGGVLIGDAAHAFHPGTGMGAQQAFVDASALSPILVNCAKGDEFGVTSLRPFEAQRRPFMNVLESTNKRNISMQLAKGRAGIWIRDRTFRAAGSLMKLKAYQEIMTGARAPTRFETLRLMMAMFAL